MKLGGLRFWTTLYMIVAIRKRSLSSVDVVLLLNVVRMKSQTGHSLLLLFFNILFIPFTIFPQSAATALWGLGSP